MSTLNKRCRKCWSEHVKKTFSLHIFSSGRTTGRRIDGVVHYLFLLPVLFWNVALLLHFLLRMITANELHLCPSPVFLSSSHSSLRFLLTSLTRSRPAMIFGLKCFWLLWSGWSCFRRWNQAAMKQAQDYPSRCLPIGWTWVPGGWFQAYLA